MFRFSLTTLGCKVNQCDGAALAGQLTSAGFRAGERGDTSPAVDLVVVNTCCVTRTAMTKSRRAIRRAVRGAPGAAVLVTGCYSDYHGRAIHQLLRDLGVPAEKTTVAGHHDDLSACIRRLAETMETSNPPPRPAPAETSAKIPWPQRKELLARRNAAVEADAAGTKFLDPIDRFGKRQRAFVKIQDGCDAFCSYCVVPYARSVVWSGGPELVEEQCRRLVAAGHKEIVLCGVFLGAFGRKSTIRRRWSGRPSALPRLLERIAALEGLWRVRLSSLEPGDLTEELLEVFCDCPKIAPHFHLPLQSGSPRILRRMNRQYTAGQYRRTVDRVRGALDRPAITTDIIVGFPSERDEDFAETLALAEVAGVSKIHAFPFSAIPGTAAWDYRHEAPAPQVVKQRLEQLAELERQLALAYRRQFLGQTLEGLTETPPSASSRQQAMTDRYISVFFRHPTGRPGQVVKLKITAVCRDGLDGQPADFS